MESTTQIFLFAISVFVGGAGIIAGSAMAAGFRRQSYPEGELEDTPFHSHIVTGLILMLAVGGSAAFSAAITFNNAETGGINAMISGCIVMAWVVGKLYILRQPWGLPLLLDIFYFGCGAAMLVLGLSLYQ